MEYRGKSLRVGLTSGNSIPQLGHRMKSDSYDRKPRCCIQDFSAGVLTAPAPVCSSSRR
jgi:hypothetical protein